jgi:hypothetical protein
MQWIVYISVGALGTLSLICGMFLFRTIVLRKCDCSCGKACTCVCGCKLSCPCVGRYADSDQFDSLAL